MFKKDKSSIRKCADGTIHMIVSTEKGILTLQNHKGVILVKTTRKDLFQKRFKITVIKDIVIKFKEEIVEIKKDTTGYLFDNLGFFWVGNGFITITRSQINNYTNILV